MNADPLWRVVRSIRSWHWTSAGRYAIRRTVAYCEHEFHKRPPAPAVPRGRIAHHPDLRAAKRSLKRALQGKDRR